MVAGRGKVLGISLESLGLLGLNLRSPVDFRSATRRLFILEQRRGWEATLAALSADMTAFGEIACNDGGRWGWVKLHCRSHGTTPSTIFPVPVRQPSE